MSQAHSLYGRVVTDREDLAFARIDIDSAGVVTAVEPVEPADASSAGPDSVEPGPRRVLIVPGLVDLHNHGGARGAFPTGTEKECRAAANFHRSQGTTALLASFVSGTEDELARQLDVVHPLVADGTLAGVHLEGPFVNAAKCGAQSPDRVIDGDPAMLERLIEAGQGTVKQVTFAPETPHADGLIEVCARHGVIVSLGHTAADYETTLNVIDTACAAGATVTATHLFNAMTPLHHRAPGAAAALLGAARRGKVACEVIGDGVHLHDGMVDLAEAAAPEGTLLVTDAMEAAGMPDGSYRLGPLDVTVTGGIARLTTADGQPGAIAGGTSTLMQQLHRFASRHGYTAAVRAASTRPAGVLGLAEDRGIVVGQPADLAVVDVTDAARPEVTRVFAAGREFSRG